MNFFASLPGSCSNAFALHTALPEVSAPCAAATKLCPPHPQLASRKKFKCCIIELYYCIIVLYCMIVLYYCIIILLYCVLYYCIMRLQGNQLNGSIPEELGQLTKLTGMRLHGNKLSRAIPEELKQLAKLTELVHCIVLYCIVSYCIGLY